MKIALIAPLATGANANPGWHFITAGIRWLARTVDAEASFVGVSMLHHDADEWAAAATCEVAIVCGNPRFTLSTGNEFWENAIWAYLAELAAAGVRVIDGWAGACFPYNEFAPTVDEMAQAIIAFPGRRRHLELARSMPHHIARDATMQRVYEFEGVPSVLLPCSSWWAAGEYAVRASEARAGDAIVLAAMPGHHWLPDAVRAVCSRMDSPRLIAPTWADWRWARDVELDTELVPDPPSLLRLFAATRRVLSFRVHAAIPAASVGAEVAVVSIDSRSSTCEPFALPQVRLTELPGWEPIFARAKLPDEATVIETMRGMLCNS